MLNNYYIHSHDALLGIIGVNTNLPDPSKYNKKIYRKAKGDVIEVYEKRNFYFEGKLRGYFWEHIRNEN